ncbi:MAG: RNA-guided endonuclease TnpB family protein [Chloroflexota bacterium]|nr:RNA-guided endonuclease TnpB family protein [Chloroflexota bacterium]
MIRTVLLPCHLAKATADALNREAGRVYSRVLVTHYRIYRKHNLWLSPAAAEKLDDFYSRADPPLLHAHSKDAAQQAFYKAVKTTHAARRAGGTPHFPHQRKWWRSCIWKATGLRLRAGRLLLARAKGLVPLPVALPAALAALPPRAFHEMRLVWDQAARHYTWHLVVEDGQVPPPPPGAGVVACDLGEIHPAALTDGQAACVVSARVLRAVRQYTAKRVSALQATQAGKTKHSRAWQRVQRRKQRFLAQQRRRIHDIEHKVSRAVVQWTVAQQAGTLVIGDVRDVADGKRLAAHSQQQISTWAHGRMRGYLTYKAAAAGITVPPVVNEAYTSQTCPQCGHRHKPQGRSYRCAACGFRGHRDIVGASNILSRYQTGEVGHIRPPPTVMYRHPIGLWRSRLDTADLAGGQLPEATRL